MKTKMKMKMKMNEEEILSTLLLLFLPLLLLSLKRTTRQKGQRASFFGERQEREGWEMDSNGD